MDKVLIKLSGKVLESPELRRGLCRQIRILSDRGMKLLLVHGAGNQLTSYCRNNRLPVVQHSGRRVTDIRTLDAAVKVFSSVNREITADLLAAGVKALGFSGFDGNLTRSRRRPPISVLTAEEKIDFGYVAEIEDVDPSLVQALWESGFTPVISSICSDREGQLLNINADTLAAELAVAIPVDLLAAVSDVEGVYLDLDDPDSLLPSLTREEAGRLLKRNVFSDGMIPKIQTAISILERGVSRYLLVSGRNPDAILNGLEGREGTLLTR